MTQLPQPTDVHEAIALLPRRLPWQTATFQWYTHIGVIEAKSVPSGVEWEFRSYDDVRSLEFLDDTTHAIDPRSLDTFLDHLAEAFTELNKEVEDLIQSLRLRYGL